MSVQVRLLPQMSYEKYFRFSDLFEIWNCGSVYSLCILFVSYILEHELHEGMNLCLFC